MRYFSFEFKRFIKHPKNGICLALLSLIFIGLFIFNETTVNQKYYDVEVANARFNLQESQKSVEVISKDLQLQPDNQDLINALVLAQEQEKIANSLLSALENKDFKTATQQSLQLNQLQLDALTDQQSEEYQKLLQRINYFQSVERRGGTPSLVINDTSEAAFTTGSRLTAWLSSTVIFVLVTVLVADTLSSEIESTQIRFYNLLGGRTLKQLLVKLTIPVMVTFLVTLTTFICLYLVKGFLGNFGTWNYPYLLDSGTILPIWKMALGSLGTFLVALVFLATLGQFLSLIFKRSLIVIGLIVVYLTGYATLMGEDWFQPFKLFFPFEYMGYGNILNDIAVLPAHAGIIGIAYLLSLSAIFLTLSAYLYSRYYFRRGE